MTHVETKNKASRLASPREGAEGRRHEAARRAIELREEARVAGRARRARLRGAESQALEVDVSDELFTGGAGNAPDVIGLADFIPSSTPRTLVEVCREHVAAVLASCGGNKSRAAIALGIDRRSLYRWLSGRGNTHFEKKRTAP